MSNLSLISRCEIHCPSYLLLLPQSSLSDRFFHYGFTRCFFLPTLFKSNFYSCLHIKSGNYHKGTHTHLWRESERSSIWKWFLQCLHVFLSRFWNDWFDFMHYFLKSFSSEPSNSYVLGYRVEFILSFWQHYHLTLANSLLITKFALMEGIKSINLLRMEDGWVEGSHTWWAF